MGIVHTVTGDIHDTDLGICDMHESVLFAKPGWDYSPEARNHLPRPEVFTDVANVLDDFRSAGGGTIVDLVGIGLGRDPQFDADLSSETGVNIIGATGFGPEPDILTYFRRSLESHGSLTKPAVYERDIDYVTNLLVRELIAGMGSTTIRAGVVTVSAGVDELTELEEMFHRSGARAARETGAALFTTGIRFAERQAEILLEEKVDPERVVIGMADEAGAIDIERDKSLAKRGFTVMYGNVGQDGRRARGATSDSDRAELVLAMLDAGHGNRVAVGCGGIGANLGRLDASATMRPSHVVQQWGELLRSRGVTEKQLDVLLATTPRRILVS